MFKCHDFVSRFNFLSDKLKRVWHHICECPNCWLAVYFLLTEPRASKYWGLRKIILHSTVYLSSRDQRANFVPLWFKKTLLLYLWTYLQPSWIPSIQIHETKQRLGGKKTGASHCIEKTQWLSIALKSGNLTKIFILSSRLQCAFNDYTRWRRSQGCPLVVLPQPNHQLQSQGRTMAGHAQGHHMMMVFCSCVLTCMTTMLHQCNWKSSNMWVSVSFFLVYFLKICLTEQR